MLLLTLLMSSVVIPSLADAQKLFVSAPVPAKISTFGIVEFEISTGRAIANPFDPEQAQVDGLLTTDDRFIRRVQRGLGNSTIRIENAVNW